VPFPRTYPEPFRRSVLAPGALLAIGGGNYHGDVVRFGGVIIDRGCGLGAEVAGPRVEIERADAVGTLRAGELHAALDALDSVGFHYLNCSPPQAGAETRWWGNERNAMANRDLPRAQVAAELRSAWTGEGGRPHASLDGRGRPSISCVTLPGGCISSGPRADGRAGGRWRYGCRCRSWFRRRPWR
jgi:hypothetical protein